jgi:hypothetical protein
MMDFSKRALRAIGRGTPYARRIFSKRVLRTI